ncbi:MAG: cysteine desulfurase family protein [Minwuia sp.]|nr:cysteine desulfurase family protein [Minwuia sp.]
MLKQRHYLDFNATTPLRPEARDAMQDMMRHAGNPSSVHAEGRSARGALDRARRQVAQLAGCSAASVCFTGGGSEANNWALHAFPGLNLLCSAVEHDSVLRPAERQHGQVIPVDAEGQVDLAALERLLAESPDALVSVMAANNETGVIQPLGDVARICAAAGARLHVDAIQAAGKLPLVQITASADLVSLSAHKLGGPAGTGAMIVRPGLEIAPLIVGGGQESWRRAGTENMIGIAGFGAAAEAAEAGLDTTSDRLRQLQDAMESELLALCPGAAIIGAPAERLANTSCIRMPGVAAETQVMALDLAGIAVSAGSACSSGKVTPSHVLRAMGHDSHAAAEAIRISSGWTTTEADTAALVSAWSGLWQRKRAA